MITYSGVHIQKIGGAAGIPTPEDIAVQSARICRFGGSVWYPLMPHLIFVGLLAYKRSGNIANFIWGVLHDAHEVATSDVPRPFKCDCMRLEQDAIDKRLLDHYLPDWIKWHNDGDLDFDLIKQCDHDACDIEAVELNLPGFAEIEIAHTKDYRNRKAVYTDADDVKLFHTARLTYGRSDAVKGLDHFSTSAFARLLTNIEKQEFEAVKTWIDSWRVGVQFKGGEK